MQGENGENRAVTVDLEPPRQPYGRLILRWIVFLAVLPLVIVASYIFSCWISYLFGIWEAYLYAVLVPLAALPCAYLMAPHWRHLSLLSCAVAGMYVGYLLLFPAYYPDWHLRAYQESYRPFKLLVFTEAAIVLLTLHHAMPAALRWLGQAGRRLKAHIYRP